MIVLEHISKSFGEENVLRDVSRRFAAGQIHGIVGNNGSGKTVMMKCICGFLRPDEGRILVGGKQVGKDFDFPPNLGVIIETPGFLPNLTAVKNLKLLASINRKIGEKEVRESIRRVGLDPDMKKPVGKYSLGMRQRLGLAQAIMEEPELLILDEPMNGLDKAGVAEMRKLLLSLKESGKTILLASHNQADIDVLCDTVCEMDGGKMTVLRDSPAPDLPEVEGDVPLVEELSLLQNLSLPWVSKLGREAAEEKGIGILSTLGLERLANARPSQVTPSQRRLVWNAQKEEDLP